MKRQLPGWAALGIIALVAGLLLALTSALTADRIEAQGVEAANAARATVLPTADDFKPVALNEEWLKLLPIDNCYEGDKAGEATGYTCQTTVKGYGGPIEVIVGMDKAGTITGVSVGGAKFTETAGLGAKTKEPKFTSQFAGKVPPLALKQNIDSVTGASISSGAVVSAVNRATSYLYYQAGLLVPEANPFDGAAQVVTKKVQGYGGEMEVSVGFDDAGVIMAVTVGGENFAETAGLGERAKEKSFRDQFVGWGGILAYGDGIDALAGATVTSTAVMEAVNAAITEAGFQDVKAEPVKAAPTPEPEPVKTVEAVETKTATAKGFGGDVEVTVGFDAEGAIASLSVGGANFAETPGIGAKAQESAFTDQFIGKKGPLTYGEGVDAIAGATVTSGAVLEAVNSLFAAPASAAPAAATTEPATVPAVTMSPATAAKSATSAACDEKSEQAEKDTPVNSTVVTKAQGFGGEIEVEVDVDPDKTVRAVRVGGAKFAETAGLGAKAQESAFTDQFVGKKGPFVYGEGVDAISGATITSNAVLEAINASFE
ncbi:MAG: RnfABCDGE type electron transport complex subunit G [Clostridia bacterium]